ncbi:hypothetical protein HDU89_008643 [Geranomyces variabilis]|nr:hypothetical protein HDU89_008643 [Geranomyces variabilis]
MDDFTAYGSPSAINGDHPSFIKWAVILLCFYLVTHLERWWPKWPPARQAPSAPEPGAVRNSRLAVLGSAIITSRTSPTQEGSREGTVAVGKMLPAREAMILFSRRRQVHLSDDGENPYSTLQRLRSEGVDAPSVHAVIPFRYLFPTDYPELPTRSLKWITTVPGNMVTDLSHPTMRVIVVRVYNAVGRVTGAFHRASLAENIDLSEIPLSLEDHITCPIPSCQVLGATTFGTCRRGVSRFTYLRTGFECCRIVIRRGLSVERFIETLAHELAHIIVHLEAKYPSNPFGRAPFKDYTPMKEGICTAVSLLAAGYLSGRDFTRSEVTDSIMRTMLSEKQDNQPESGGVKERLPNLDALAGRGFVKESYEDTFRHVMKHIDLFSTFLDLLDTYLKHGFI